MSDHLDAPDPQTDICDLYVFARPGSPNQTILVLDVNPEAPKHASAFDHRASYEWKIDTDGDLFADLAYHVLFSEPVDGQQTATLYRAVGPAAEQGGAVGQVVIAEAPVCFGEQVRVSEGHGLRLFAGMRSDPFFLDLEGYLHNFQWTGQNVNATNNVFSMVLELPNTEMGNSRRIGVWARTLAPLHGELHQMDQAGRPGTSPLFFVGQEQQALFNGSHPSWQQERFAVQVIRVLEERYGFSPEEARSEALQWLPDLLPFELGCTETYPNGRWLNDDTLAIAGLTWTRGRCGPSLSKGNPNLLRDFPYLGNPHSTP
jgi:hypothetical protein